MGAQIQHDQPDADYRAVDAASCSALKHILDSPARYQWEKTHRVHKAAFDFGHVVHSLVLGVGEPLHVIDAPDWRSKTAREERDAAHAAGEVPLLTHEYETAKACAARVTSHPLAGPIITSPGHSETSIYWDDDETGLACKGRIDRTTITADGTHWLIDLKTTGQTANPDAFGRTAANLGYHMQAAYYMHGYAAATGIDPEQIEWVNVIAETKEPHEVSVTAFDAPTLDAGRARWRHALDLLASCQDRDEWPGYTSHEAALISVPRYALNEEWN